MLKRLVKPTVVTLFLYFVSTGVSAAPPPPEYIQFRPEATKGVLYRPDPDRYTSPHIALIIMHRDSNFLSHIVTREMPKRGFLVLAMNPRCDNNEALCVPWENNALDLKQGMDHLRQITGITRIVLLGHSGGGPTMSFYQAVAENGVSICQEPQKLIKCSDRLAGLPAADGLILWDSHPGNGVNAVRSLNPMVTNDREIIENFADPALDRSLDLFDPANGYNPDGESRYSDAFKERYFKAQSARMNRLIDIALDKMKRIEAGNYRYPDDDVFIVPRGNASRLFSMDLSVENSSDRPARLLKNDGTIEDCCVVNSVRAPGEDPENNETFRSGAIYLSLKSFLSVRAIRSTDSINGIDWCSSNNSAPCNLQKVSVPLLVVAMGGHYFIRDGEKIYDMANSADKDFIVIEGATHGGTPCRECMPDGQKYDGRYDNAVKNNFDYLASWINKRF
jgi:hypothetical protein